MFNDNAWDIVEQVVNLLPGTKKILENKRKLEIVEKEGLGNIVTNVDMDLESYLCESLKAKFPEAQIISEESADSCAITKCCLKFVVDPLDGSTNFSNGWPHSIAIGIVSDQELIGGVIYDVINDTIYSATKNKGVIKYSINDMERPEKVKVPKYHKDVIKKSVISHDTPYGDIAFGTTIKMYENLVRKGASAKTVGPISLDVLKVALGIENRVHDYNDAVWHLEVRAWDLCAATAILRELGGEIIGTDGKPLSIEVLISPSEKIAFIASGNKKLRDAIYQVYKEIAQ